MSDRFVAVLMGSDSDLPVVEGAFQVLKSLGIRAEGKVTSAHRTPDAARAYVADAEARGFYSTVMMPGGIPVAAMGIGKSGAKNAAYLAAEIMALSDPELDAAVKAERKARAEDVARKDQALQKKLENV